MLHHEPENEFSSFSGNLCIGFFLFHIKTLSLTKFSPIQYQVYIIRSIQNLPLSIISILL